MNKKIKKEKLGVFSPEKVIRNLLSESGFKKDKRFHVKSKNGRLVVRFNKEDYE